MEIPQALFLFTLANCSARLSFICGNPDVSRHEAYAGGNVTLRCHTTKNVAVDWRFQKTSDSDIHYIYASGNVAQNFRPRFTVHNDGKGNYDLVVSDAQLGDSGLYMCIEEAGMGRRHLFDFSVQERRKRAFIGEEVRLRCDTSLDADVDWRYQENPTSQVYYVYTNGVVYDLFKDRFSVDSSTKGRYDLVISDFLGKDEGLYICIEDSGMGKRHVTQLLVLELPSPESICVTDISSASISLSWTFQPIVTENFTIQYKAIQGDKNTSNWKEISVANETQHTVDGLEPLTKYDLQVLTTSGAAHSRPSSTVRCRTIQIYQTFHDETMSAACSCNIVLYIFLNLVALAILLIAVYCCRQRLAYCVREAVSGKYAKGISDRRTHKQEYGCLMRLSNKKYQDKNEKQPDEVGASERIDDSLSVAFRPNVDNRLSNLKVPNDKLITSTCADGIDELNETVCTTKDSPQKREKLLETLKRSNHPEVLEDMEHPQLPSTELAANTEVVVQIEKSEPKEADDPKHSAGESDSKCPDVLKHRTVLRSCSSDYSSDSGLGEHAF